MQPAPIDPPEIHNKLWDGFDGPSGWDVGANCGQTLPEMASRFDTVYAFEPASECWPYLEKVTTGISDGQQVKLLKIAVTDENAPVDLVALPDKINTGQLVTGNCEGMEWNPRDDGAVVRTVPGRTVDSLAMEFGIPDFMKIDVEGHEAKVLSGAVKTVDVRRPDFLIEFHSPELFDFCIDFLKPRNYVIEVVRHPHYPVGSPFWYQHGWIKAFG